MKKIPSLFQRNYDGDRLARDEVVPGCEWILAGEGVATLKLDGTACLVQDDVLYKRYDAKKGKTPPVGWVPCEEAPDPNTNHWPGWLLVGDGPEDRWHQEAFACGPMWGGAWAEGTYELMGPKVQGNPHRYAEHLLVRHGGIKLHDAPRDFAGLKAYFSERVIEGIVWWRDLYNPDCDKVKIKRKDFGYPWPVKKVTE